MNGQLSPDPAELASKIARLVEERGWNQEDFARISNLNRLTVRQILTSNGERRLRNATVGACAKALGLTVSELRHLPLEQLLARMNRLPSGEGASLRRLYEQATQPELIAWMERNPERAAQLSADEIDELLSLQGTGGPLTSFGVQHFIEMIERKHKLLQQVQVIAGTEYLDLLEKLVALMYDKVQPYADRKLNGGDPRPALEGRGI
jgi:transcriptional regulator with XRE-family HTH domain